MTGVSEGVRCMKIGFIGLGRMGSAMAANLVKAGHQVTVFNRSPDKRRKLVELGAHEAARIADACRGEAVITMLADDAALSSVTLADGGIVASLPKGAIHVSMSTVSVALARELTKAHADAGQRFIAAPVFGRPEAAAESLGVPMLLGALLRRRFLRLLAQGGENLDWSALGGLAARDAADAQAPA